MSIKNKNTLPAPQEEGHAQLERYLINEYLEDKGHTMKSVKSLPEDEARRLMNSASTYASGKLAEIEDKSRFSKDIKDIGRYMVS